MDPNRVTLLINNVRVPRNDPNGWDFDGGNPFQITVRGDACDAIVTGDPNKNIQLVEDCQRP